MIHIILLLTLCTQNLIGSEEKKAIVEPEHDAIASKRELFHSGIGSLHAIPRQFPEQKDAQPPYSIPVFMFIEKDPEDTRIAADLGLLLYSIRALISDEKNTYVIVASIPTVLKMLSMRITVPDGFQEKNIAPLIAYTLRFKTSLYQVKSNQISESFFIITPKTHTTSLSMLNIKTEDIQEIKSDDFKKTLMDIYENKTVPFNVQAFLSLFEAKKAPTHHSIWYITGHGLEKTEDLKEGENQIAGLPLDDFQRLLQFLNTKQYTQLLMLRSCFAIGNLQELLQKQKSPLRFPIIVEGTESVPSYFNKYVKPTWETYIRNINKQSSLEFQEVVPYALNGLLEGMLPRTNQPQIIHPNTQIPTPLFPGLMIGRTLSHTRTAPWTIPWNLTSWKMILPKASPEILNALYQYVYLKTPYVPFTLNFSQCHLEKLVLVPSIHHQKAYAFEEIIIPSRKSILSISII